MKKRSLFLNILCFIPMLLVMVLIFFFSCMEGDESAAQSGLLLDAMAKLVKEISHHGLSDLAMSNLHIVIRKIAHFTEYFALGMTIMLAIYHYFTHRPISILVPELLAVLYAVSDEFHQYFVPGRYGTYGDVIIDGCGALVGIIIYYNIKGYFMINKYERRSRKASKRLRKKASKRNKRENLVL